MSRSTLRRGPALESTANDSVAAGAGSNMMSRQFSSCWVREDVLMREVIRTVIHGTIRQHLLGYEFHRHYFQLSEFDQYIGITTNARSGHILFVDMVTSDSLHSIYWIDNRPVHQVAYLGERVPKSPWGSGPQFSIRSRNPHWAGDPVEWTDEFRTQLTLELGEIHLPDQRLIELMNASIDYILMSDHQRPAVHQLEHLYLSLDGLPRNHSFRVRDPMIFFMDVAESSVGYQYDQVIQHRLHWLCDQLTRPIPTRGDDHES